MYDILVTCDENFNETAPFDSGELEKSFFSQFFGLRFAFFENFNKIKNPTDNLITYLFTILL